MLDPHARKADWQKYWASPPGLTRWTWSRLSAEEFLQID
jgi:hypothetical protein